MAICVPGPTVQAIEGDLGGETYKAFRGTTVIARASAPANSPSGAQLSLRARNSRIWQAWIDCSAATRRAWDYAGLTCPYIDRFGERRQYSGWQCFQFIHAIGWELEPYQTLSPPIPGLARSPCTLSFHCDNSPWYKAEWTPYDHGVPLYAIIHGQPTWSNARKPHPRHWRRLFSGNYKFTGEEISKEWIARFGELKTGQPAHIRVRWYEPGNWPSLWVHASTTCSAA